MAVRLFLFVTGLISFLYFLFPESFSFANTQDNDVLGIEKRTAAYNKPTIDTVLLAYCITEGKLPKNLNELYEGYLRERPKLDLDKLYHYKRVDSSECEYELNS